MYSSKEFKTKARNHDYLLTTVLRGAKQFVKGDDGELAAVAVNGGGPRAHQTSKKEVDNLRLITRDLADAAVAALSADRRFATAYNAALQVATIAIACSG
ncbi:MAG: hypothetical protein H0X25_21040 [Acidobacteriales bacterium]|nr:hypothetical protein [Terriglobales bacterium]